MLVPSVRLELTTPTLMVVLCRLSYDGALRGKGLDSNQHSTFDVILRDSQIVGLNYFCLSAINKLTTMFSMIICC